MSHCGVSIYEVSLSSGTIDNTLTVGSSISVSAFDSRENLALGTGEKQLIVSSIGNGQVLLRKAITQMPTSLRFLDSGSIAVGDDRGNVTIYDKDGKEEWAFRNGATISFLETVEDELLAASHDNFLYLLNVSNGGVIWKRRLSGRIAHAPIVVADSIFVVAYGDHFAYEIDRKSGKIINKFRISAEDLPITGPVKLDSRTFALPANKAIAIYSAGICKQK